MFQSGIRMSFTARHALRGDFGTEAQPHSHPYIVEWACGASSLDGNGFSVDISAMRIALSDAVSGIHERFLNDLPFFRERQPSLENVALYLHGKCREALGTGARMTVRIWESDSAWASYES